MSGELKVKIEIEVTPEDARALRVLARGLRRFNEDGVDDDATPAEALEEFVRRVNDGVHRGGSWERKVMLALFGDKWIDLMRPDPHNLWREVPVE
jgi:hypothetical protein